jgi:membrane protein DedA with SNARE-associated domain
MHVSLIIPAFLISGHQIDDLLGRWGYWVVFVVVLAQASGVPVPGTTALAAAAVYAGTTHRLAIAGVIVAAAAGAIIGFAVSFAVGRYGGWRLLDRYGARFGLTEVRRRSARAFFAARGGAVVVLSRFVTGLRTWGGLLAGANLMPWPKFLVMNVIGGLAWSIANGIGYYLFGNAINSASTAVQIALVAFAVLSFLATMAVLRHRARTFIRANDPEGSRAAE